MTTFTGFGKIMRSVLLLFTLMLLGTGCALTKDFVNLDYSPQQGVAKVAGAEKVDVSVKMDDQRTRKDRVSSKKNGYGMEMAAIISNNDVAALVSTAITDELRNRGFKIGGNRALVSIELTKFYNDFKIGFWSGSAVAEVVMNVQVKKPDGNIVYAKAISGEHTLKGVQLMSGENARASLNEALKDAVSKLMDDKSFMSALVQSGA